ncbi:MAG: dehydrogenase subunit [Deltaproteobacteria bacterium]|nr:dehydrogenase subunit [Deltaproteobacteria bacterium]
MIIPLLKGLKVTLGYFFSKPITVQYPEEKVPPAKRWRGIQYFEKDERGKTKCVGCGLCMAVCPSQCIYIETAEDEEGRRYPLTYELDGKGYEWVEGNRKVYLMTTEKLLEEKKFNP